MTVPYVATINIPGYLPMDDEPPIFETAQEAWQYLAEERELSESEFVYDDRGVDGHNGEFACALSETLHVLIAHASDKWLVTDFERAGTVYGDTPGYDGDHDLGLAYCVTWTDETAEEN